MLTFILTALQAGLVISILLALAAWIKINVGYYKQEDWYSFFWSSIVFIAVLCGFIHLVLALQQRNS